nr:MAG TPA: tail protein [Bacteriophage sp.]
MATEAKNTNYWISSTALSIQLNAMGEPDYIQCSVVSGASILCYMSDVPGLGYDAGHNYQRWTLAAYPSIFPDSKRKYVYIAIPRQSTTDNNQATVVFPGQKIDIYGKTIPSSGTEGVQIGNEAYYYIFTGGIISAVKTDADNTRKREWEQHFDCGKLATHEAIASGGEGAWWRYNSVSDTITFLKEILKANFNELSANVARVTSLFLGGHKLKGVADSNGTLETSNDTVVTPQYLGQFGVKHFLAKDKDDTAAGLITFLKGLRLGKSTKYYIDADGNLIINLLNSADYDDAMQSGFGFYRRKDGKYGLNVTDLSVWGKAYFNNLTIRELTYVGGNLVFSSSAGKIFEVREITDAQDEVTGWKCYLLADDGTTATTNMFEVDDQVRCETFNIKAGVYENVSNKFYWRKITEVSTDNEEITDANNNILYDGKKFSWIVISASDKAEGSDTPAAGDTIVLMGNRMNTNRMSFVVKETYGDNAPREVGYTNVHSYTLGNDNLVYEISPKKVRLYSQYFEIVTIEGLPIKTINYRGDWKQGDTYVYYDQVTHNGTTWLCVAPEGTNVTSEPARGNDFWKAQNAILDATLNITQSTGEWIDKGETNHVECSVIRGFENITDQVTSWNIVRDSGDAVNDAAWQNKDKVKNFDGTIDIAWTDDDDDIGDSTSCIFTITAFWGNKVELAKGTISV